MKPYFEAIVVLPIGPNSSVEFTADTINSFIFYTKSSYKIVLADDSQQGIGARMKTLFPDADIITTKKAMGGWAGLYITLSLAYRHAVINYDFSVLIKLDTDALIIGEAPEKDIIAYFKTNAQIGIAGQYPLDYFGQPWNSNWPKQRIINNTSTWKFISKPIGNWRLRKLYKLALQNGYNTGESVFGGAYSMSFALLTKLFEEGLLPHYQLGKVHLGEDHIFSLLAKAIGFDLGNCASAGLPFGCAWKGLPVSPEQLITDKKKITHSVRFWQNMDEAAVRTYFSNIREAKCSVSEIL